MICKKSSANAGSLRNPGIKSLFFGKMEKWGHAGSTNDCGLCKNCHTIEPIHGPPPKVKSDSGGICQGATRLFLIVVSACTFLIWNLRRKRIFEENPDHQIRIIFPQVETNQFQSSTIIF